MRVLHVSYHKTWRGGERQITYLVGELNKLTCSQWIFCSNGNALEKYCEENGLPFYTFSNNLFSKLINIAKLNSICSKHAIDLIHVHDSKTHMMVYLSSLTGNKIPIVVSRRIDTHLRNSIITRKKYNFSGIKNIICVSEKIRKTLYSEIEDPSKLVVIHDGIDVDKFRQSKNKGILRKKYQVPEQTKIIGKIAALEPVKDYFTFIDTAEILLKNGLDAWFFIIGNGSMKKELQRYVANKDLTRNFVFTGFRKDIPSILCELDLFLFTSSNEGLGTSILDAFAAGVPVVSTNAGGIPEIIDHEVSGMLADVKDSKKLAENVMKVLNDNAFRENLVKNASAKVELFSKQIMAQKTFNLYQKILSQLEIEEESEFENDVIE